MPNSEPLFFKYDISSVMEGHRQKASQLVRQINGNSLLNTPTEDIVSDITAQVRFDIPVLHRDQAHADQREAQVPVHDYFSRGYDGVRHVQGTMVELFVPYTGDKDFFFIRPSTFDNGPPRATVENDHLTIRIAGQNLAQAAVKQELDRTLDAIERYLGWQRASAAELNASLPNLIRTAVDQRKNKLMADQNLVAGLGYNLKPRADAPKTYVAPSVRRKVQVQKTPASTAPFKPEPVLDESNYKAILDIIQSMALVMERSPTAFAAMGEEDLRQHFLVQLNGQFEGKASGETFNYQGKTDILIREQDRNTFIAECKFWRGEKSFLETLDQILSYLSWRDTKVAVLIFNRNKGLSDVLAKIKETTKTHPHFKRGPTVEGETRFRYVFGNPSDHNREIVLTVKRAAPFEVELTPPVVKQLQADKVAAANQPRQTVSDLSYLGDEGGIMCHIAPPESDSAIIISLTHVLVPRSMPLATAVLAYQKHRVKKLKKQRYD